ncbi:hypothetical protein ACFY00_23130 [Kitasatospora sp. NPDC001540]|uniref:hypothetical protein n=1 Tax=Kitasatospora sp. NPDC001540 TaxID=3364014 RepID=UPI0036996764
MVVDRRRRPRLLPVGGGLDADPGRHAARIVGVRAREQPHGRRGEPQWRAPRVPQRRRQVQPPVADRPHQGVVGRRPQGGRQPVGAGAVPRVQQVRQLTTGTVDDRTGVVVKEVGPYASWPALKGVTRIDTVLPVFDEQEVNGKSAYWVFHTVDGNQFHRYVTIGAAEPHPGQLVADDQPVSRWRSFGGSTPVTHVDAFLPVPDQRPAADGSFWCWMFHHTPVGQRYRLSYSSTESRPGCGTTKNSVTKPVIVPSTLRPTHVG